MTSFRPSFRAAGLALALLAVGGVAQAQTVSLVTKAAIAQQGAGGVGPLPPGARVLSDDGRYLVFESDAPNVVAGQVDLNGEPDVFLHDRVADTLTLVSHVPGSAVTTGDLASFGARISADGDWIAFVSFATDLVAGTDANLGGSDVYLFSRVGGAVTLVSHSTAAPTTSGNAGSEAAEISADGAFVAFVSSATDLVAGSDTNVAPDVFLFQRSGGAVSLVSHASGSATTAANDVSLAPQLSADGRYVAFASDATNLVTGQVDGNGKTDVFLFDRLGATALVSHAAGSAVTAADDQSEAPTVSADGAWVAYQSDAENLVAAQVDPNGKSDVFVYGRAATTNTLASRSSGSATTAGNERSRVALVSADGNWVAFESRASDLVAGGGDTNLLEDVFLFSRAAGTVALASHRPALPTTTGNDASFVSGLTADGSRVAFHSLASDLTAGADGNLTEDIFLFDRVGGGVALVSHALAVPANAANGFSSEALPSADGSVVAFMSAASNLIAPTGALGRELYAHVTGTGANSLVSRAATASTTAAGLALVEPPHRRTVSEDGRWVVFTSDAPNLVPGQVDPNGEPDVFLYDALNDSVTLVSHAFGLPARAGNADSARPSLSADGAWVAFATNATDLLATPQLECQVYLWERATGTVTLVSHAAASAAQAGNDCSDGPALSANGAWVAFYSLATDLVAGVTDNNDADDVFLFERASGLVQLASPSASGTSTGNGGTPLVFGRGHDAPALSADGRYVAFPSLATNLVAGVTDGNGAPDVFLRDRVAGTTTLVSRAATAAATGNGASDAPLLSADGAWLAYSSLATNLVAAQADANGGADVFVFSRASGTSALISHAAGLPATAANAPAAEHALSADGAWLAWSSAASNVVTGVTDANGASDVFAQPRATGLSILVSRAAGAPTTAADAASAQPTLAANGNSVAFVSSASNLAPGVTDANGLDDVFLYDRFHDTMALVSHVPSPVTTPGNSVSGPAAVSGAGNHVVFASAATNLVPGDLAGPVDVFYSTLPPVPVELEAFTIE